MFICSSYLLTLLTFFNFWILDVFRLWSQHIEDFLVNILFWLTPLRLERLNFSNFMPKLEKLVFKRKIFDLGGKPQDYILKMWLNFLILDRSLYRNGQPHYHLPLQISQRQNVAAILLNCLLKRTILLLRDCQFEKPLMCLTKLQWISF